jgi:transposase
MQVFPSENQECLLTGLKRIFYHIGGVPLLIRCDNMTTAVAQVLVGTERILSEGFIRFMLHYRFEATFCNPAKGNEKGNVENKVGYTRRNMLVSVPVIVDFNEFNAELLILCDDD